MTEPITVVCGADEHYALPMAVTLYSALVNLEAGWSVDIYVLDGGLQQASKARLERVVDSTNPSPSLHWIPFNREKVSHLPTRDWISSAAYARLFIPELLPDETSKAIYLDSDLQVEASLSKLWRRDLDGHALMAVQAYGTPYVSSARGLDDYADLGLDSSTPYFNTGILVLNLEKWRRKELTQSVIEYRRRSDDPDTVDQGALNAVLAHDWKPLDLKWNAMSHLVNFADWPESPFKERVRPRREELLHDPYIHHFAGGSKPWQVGCNHPAQVRWIGYLWESGWFVPAEQVRRLGTWFLRYYWWHVKKRLGLLG